MPMEDIDFLGANSEIDSTLFFLDSDSRDRTAYPTPAEYVIQFTEPIKLVIGVDILDATIPAAMYIIDANTDTLTVTTLDGNGMGDGEAQTIFAAILLGSSALLDVMSTPTTPTGYCFLVDKVDIETVRNASVASLARTDATSGFAFLIIVQNPASATVTPDSACSLITFPFASAVDMDNISSSLTRVLTIRKASIKLQHGNYDIVTLMLILSATLKQIAIDDETIADSNFAFFEVISPSSGTVSLQGRYAFINHMVPFVMDMRASITSMRSVLGFSNAPDPLAGSTGAGYNAFQQTGFGSVLSSTVATATFSNTAFKSAVHIVVAPGIANLLGVRYITLRCPEIEQHLYSGMTYGSHSTGLGVFKLPSGSEVSNLRFDFVSLVRRPFHPIGRLSRLTLRFEKNDGTLYDFKGINTQLLLAVKFLSPGKRLPLTRSVLNPDYDPDFLRYTLRLSASEAVETSESNRIGLAPNLPACPSPFEAHDQVGDEFADRESVKGNDASDGGADSDGEGEDGAAVFLRRQEIARRLLQQQDKYDYPSSQHDGHAWRAV